MKTELEILQKIESAYSDLEAGLLNERQGRSVIAALEWVVGK